MVPPARPCLVVVGEDDEVEAPALLDLCADLFESIFQMIDLRQVFEKLPYVEITIIISYVQIVNYRLCVTKLHLLLRLAR